MDNNQFRQLPSLGGAPNLTSLSIQHNPRLVLSAASVDQLAAEAPNLQELTMGGTAAAAIRLTKHLAGLSLT